MFHQGEASRRGCTRSGSFGRPSALKRELISDISGKRGATYGEKGVCRRIKKKGTPAPRERTRDLRELSPEATILSCWRLSRREKRSNSRRREEAPITPSRR